MMVYILSTLFARFGPGRDRGGRSNRRLSTLFARFIRVKSIRTHRSGLPFNSLREIQRPADRIIFRSHNFQLSSRDSRICLRCMRLIYTCTFNSLREIPKAALAIVAHRGDFQLSSRDSLPAAPALPRGDPRFLSTLFARFINWSSRPLPHSPHFQLSSRDSMATSFRGS